jgi:predicted ester cyclase
MAKSIIMLAAIAFMAIGCNSNKTASTSNADSTSTAPANAKMNKAEENKAKAIAALESFNKHDAGAVLKDAAPDFVDYGDGSMPPAKGIDSCKKFIESFLVTFPDMKGENLMAVAEGNRVAVFGDWSGTFKGAMMGMKPTGKSFKIKDVDLFTFNDQGQITEHHSVQSMQTIMSQVGASMK